jgi:hypothetical protein
MTNDEIRMTNETGTSGAALPALPPAWGVMLRVVEDLTQSGVLVVALGNADYE